jgi:hypothetical protein
MVRVALVAFLICVFADGVAFSQPFEELLERSDVGGFAPSTFRARLALQREGQEPANEIELWRSGSTRTLVRLLNEDDRGKYLLRLGTDLWFIAPRVSKPVRLNPSHRIYGAATIDVILGLRLFENYRIVETTVSQDSQGGVVVFDLAAQSESIQFSSVRYVVRRDTELPVSALYRLASGRPAVMVEFSSWAGARNDQRYAKEIQVRDLLRQESPTKISVLDFEIRDVPADLFELTNSDSRRALEQVESLDIEPVSPKTR